VDALGVRQLGRVTCHKLVLGGARLDSQRDSLLARQQQSVAGWAAQEIGALTCCQRERLSNAVDRLRGAVSSKGLWAGDQRYLGRLV
jgi:hypothetical protein